MFEDRAIRESLLTSVHGVNNKRTFNTHNIYKVQSATLENSGHGQDIEASTPRAAFLIIVLCTNNSTTNNINERGV